mmetsp:Transcript_17426/g.48394  ORF Transcript_17426/g.48394 Transcript_17426/m.48394 type:complete len:458 (-) Transcript_17426:1684-3057(-)
MHGPISAEHMIIGYLQGTLGDSSMVCGVTSECTANHRPAYDSFEPIGVLLEKINLGGHYMLVTLNEMLGLPPPAPNPPSYQPSPLPTYTNPAPVAPLPTYQAPAAPAALPTYSASPLPTYSAAAPPPSGPPLPLYSPSSAGAVGMVPESSRMVVQQQPPQPQQQPRSSLGAGLVGAPPPYGLPPTHHHLSPRNLHSLRTGHHRHKSNNASRTSLASSVEAAPQAFTVPQHPLPVPDPQQPAMPAAQAQHDPYPHLQQGSTPTAATAAVGLRSRSSLDSGSSGFPGGEGDTRSSPPLSPPSETMQPALATAAAVAASAHPNAVPANGVVIAPHPVTQIGEQPQVQQLPSPPPPPSLPPPLQQQQQQQQQERVGLTEVMGDQAQNPLQNRHEGSALPSATARISLAAPAGQKSVCAAKSEIDASRESESADEHNHVAHNMRSALNCSGDLERPVLSLST